MGGADFLDLLVRLIGAEEAARCARKFGPPDEEFYEGINNAEAIAFYVYSTANGWHSYINAQLWSRKPHPDVVAFAAVLDSGIHKLPRYTTGGGTVYRGYHASDLGKFSKHYVLDEIVAFPAFTSASFKEAGAFGGNVLFIIRALSARAIWFLSPNFQEEEALLPTNCSFVVVDKGMQQGRLVVIVQETEEVANAER